MTGPCIFLSPPPVLGCHSLAAPDYTAHSHTWPARRCAQPCPRRCRRKIAPRGLCTSLRTASRLRRWKRIGGCGPLGRPCSVFALTAPRAVSRWNRKRVVLTGSPVMALCKYTVFQRTGLPWLGVTTSLTTAAPRVGVGYVNNPTGLNKYLLV